MKYITLLAVSTFLASCKDNEIFEREMYKNVVALISSNYYNTFQEVVPLTGEEVTGYISASVGGTDAPSKDMSIPLELDTAQLRIYNRSLFDGDEKLYARLLPAEKYEISDYNIHIKAGERTGRTLVKLRPDGLSPDSTYFIGLKAGNTAGIEITEKKRTILYQVVIKNAYASQAENAFYSMSGMVNEMVTAGNKKLFPLTSNSVRVIAGTESFESKVDHIQKTAIILEMNPAGNITIKPYKNIKVTQIDGDERYPNSFRVEESYGRKFNVFLLSYEYVINGAKKRMQEELRLEIKP